MKLKNLEKKVASKVVFKVEEIIPYVYNVRFKKQKDLTSTFLRLQEFYESPEFRNKHFSLQEFHEWYSKQHKGKFTYLSDWTGFNIPSSIVDQFIKKFKLNTREKALIKPFKRRKLSYYLIGTYGSKKDYKAVLKHEIAHAMFYQNKSYKRAVLKILKNLKKDKIFKFLKNLGYHPKVWLDETHAFILTDYDSLKKQKVHIPKNIQKEIENTFGKYFKKVA